MLLSKYTRAYFTQVYIPVISICCTYISIYDYNVHILNGNNVLIYAVTENLKIIDKKKYFWQNEYGKILMSEQTSPGCDRQATSATFPVFWILVKLKKIEMELYEHDFPNTDLPT